MGFVKGKLRLLRREGLRGEGGAADAAGYGLLTQAGCVRMRSRGDSPIGLRVMTPLDTPSV